MKRWRRGGRRATRRGCAFTTRLQLPQAWVLSGRGPGGRIEGLIGAGWWSSVFATVSNGASGGGIESYAGGVWRAGSGQKRGWCRSLSSRVTEAGRGAGAKSAGRSLSALDAWWAGEPCKNGRRAAGDLSEQQRSKSGLRLGRVKGSGCRWRAETRGSDRLQARGVTAAQGKGRREQV